MTAEIARNGWSRAGLLGTPSTMTGTVYLDAFRAAGVEKLIPEAEVHARFDEIVFQEVNQRRWLDNSRQDVIDEIEKLKDCGADCVIMGCTEFPILVSPEQSPLPLLESTRLLAAAAVDLSLGARPAGLIGG